MNRLRRIMQRGFVTVEIDFAKEPRWHLGTIPSEPGWYFITTTAPIDVLRRVGRPRENRNYNIPQKITGSQYLIDNDLAIQQIKRKPYAVYSGQAANLLNRARENSFGGSGTGCLAIAKYPSLRKYKWYFSYLTCDKYDPASNGDKILRNLGEQIWRCQNGWPILCSQ